MSDSILSGKWILAVDDEPDVLDVLAEEILAECPDVKFDTATTFEEAQEMLALSATTSLSSTSWESGDSTY